MKPEDFVKKIYEQEMRVSRHVEPGPKSVALILDHLKPSFNVGKIYRSAYGFGAQEIHLVNVGVFDPRPAKGCVRKLRTRHFESFAASELDLTQRNFQIFALDPRAEQSLGAFELPENCAFVLGHEEFGLSFKEEDFPSVKRLRIPQFGRVESLNVSVAASIALYEYVRQRC